MDWALVPGGGVEPQRTEVRRILSPNPFFSKFTIHSSYRHLRLTRESLCAVLFGPLMTCWAEFGQNCRVALVVLAGPLEYS